MRAILTFTNGGRFGIRTFWLDTVKVGLTKRWWDERTDEKTPGPYGSGFQTGVRGPKGVRDGFPWGPREYSEK